MDARKESKPSPMKYSTTAERMSERESVVTRIFSGPARIVFEAWTKPELLQPWWTPSPMDCTSFPARWMFIREACIASCSGTLPPRSRWSSSVGTSKWRLTRAWCGRMRKVVKVGLSPR